MKDMVPTQSDVDVIVDRYGTMINGESTLNFEQFLKFAQHLFKNVCRKVRGLQKKVPNQ
jgi:hypothetical protein